MTRIALSGEVGPLEAATLKTRLARACAVDRPFVEVDLVGVTSLHLGALNALVLGEKTAHRNRGTLTVRAGASSAAREVLARFGLDGGHLS